MDRTKTKKLKKEVTKLNVFSVFSWKTAPQWAIGRCSRELRTMDPS